MPYRSPFDYDGKKRDDAALVFADMGNNYAKGRALTADGIGISQTDILMPYGFIKMSEGDWKREENQAKRRTRTTPNTSIFSLYDHGARLKDNARWTPYIVGEAAYRSRDNAAVIDTSKYQAGIMDAYLYAALDQLFPAERFPKGHNNILLAIAHPPTEDMFADMLLSTVTGWHRGENASGQRRDFFVSAAITYDEGVAAAVHWQHHYDRVGRDTAGKYTQKALEPGEAGITIDVGGRVGSIGMFYVRDDGTIEPDFRSYRRIDGGILTVYDALNEQIKSIYAGEDGWDFLKHTSKFNNRQLREMVETQQYVAMGDKAHPLDVNRAVVNSLGVINILEEIWYNAFNGGEEARHVIITGGGSDTLYPYILEVVGDHKGVKTAAPKKELIKANLLGGQIIAVSKWHYDQVLPAAFQKLVKEMEIV